MLCIYKNQYYNIIQQKIIINDIKNQIELNEIDGYNKLDRTYLSGPFFEYFN